MAKPFSTLEEVAEYISGDLIKCLECGRWFKHITGKHLHSHELTPDQYRDKWGLPRGTPLMGQASRRKRSRIAHRLIKLGRLNYSHLPRAVEVARKMHRDKHVPAVRERHRDIIKQVRPGDWSLLPAKSNRADGRNADRAREYQRAYRALKDGNPEPMWQYKKNGIILKTVIATVTENKRRR